MLKYKLSNNINKHLIIKSDETINRFLRGKEKKDRHIDREIYSRLSRCSTARGSSSRLFKVGPTKVKARKYILFTEGSPVVEVKILQKCSAYLEGTGKQIDKRKGD